MQKNDGLDADTEYGLYEVGYLLVPIIAEDVAHSDGAALSELLTSHGATIKTADHPQMRPLAYEMTKKGSGKNTYFDTAYFGSIVFEVSVPAIAEISAGIKKMPNVLRFLIIETGPDVLAPRERRVMGKIEPEKYRPEKSATPAAPVSEAELDKTIAALVAE